MNVLGLGSTIIETTLIPFQETEDMCNLLTYSWSKMAAKAPASHTHSRHQNGGEDEEWTYYFLRGLSRILALLLLVSHWLGLTDTATLCSKEEPWKGIRVEMFQLSLGERASFWNSTAPGFSREVRVDPWPGKIDWVVIFIISSWFGT